MGKSVTVTIAAEGMLDITPKGAIRVGGWLLSDLIRQAIPPYELGDACMQAGPVKVRLEIGIQDVKPHP